jgi:hypothetical protein
VDLGWDAPAGLLEEVPVLHAVTVVVNCEPVTMAVGLLAVVSVRSGELPM